MKRLKQGSIVAIPLLHGLGFAYAKYINAQKLDSDVSYPDILKVYSTRFNTEVIDVNNLSDYLISPILVAGLRPTLTKGYWRIIGIKEFCVEDNLIPDFFEGHSTDSDLPKNTWYKYIGCDTNNRSKTTYEEIKYLQPYVGQGSGNIEIKLTMYFMLKESIRVEDFFDLTDFNNNRLYNQVLDSLLLV